MGRIVSNNKWTPHVAQTPGSTKLLSHIYVVKCLDIS